ncbi:hypothetical protein [Pseudoclavibacter sp. AY1H1]|uniref:hypothetical protein n=1 Tax=Pseudoclavibacter sp. AY1H1 TaxID=2080584 RepID=UPI000CE86E08|nr:hypothetical protein [Pseudoclavibacter sp. AY1H1]PPF32811.1 hypothetical protein C5E05_18920 [Pseudoclavibacter sp. AY1H1]PPF74736.1 hypothetical protein C5B99_13355 [Pseudoclavibacter sp. Z016]
MFEAHDPGGEISVAELVPSTEALEALTLRCAEVRYRGMHDQELTREVTWMPLVTAPRDAASWLLWSRVPPCYPDESPILPVRGLGEMRVVVDGVAYRSRRYNYLTARWDELPQGGWMAS